MAHSLKITPPTWDSDKDGDKWRDFCHQFESFVDYQPNGDTLLTLACKILGRSTKFAASIDTMDDALSFSAPAQHAANEEEQDEENNEENEHAERQVLTVRDLNPDEQLLDRKLHNILDNCVFGSKRDCILSIRQRSWIQAWVALNKDMGATNIKRKTELMGELVGLEFKHPPAKAKHDAMELIRKVYDTKITMEELMMYCVIQSFPEEFLALKIMLTQKLEEAHGKPTEVHDFVTFAYSCLELTHTPTSKALKTSSKKACSRCGWDNHHAKDCYATKHRNGAELPPNGKQKPSHVKDQGAQDDAPPAQEQEEKDDKDAVKAHAIAVAKRLLAKAEKM